MAKEKVLAKVATLLEKFSQRLITVARETRQNTDSVATLRDETRLKIGKMQEALEIGVEAVAQRQWAHHQDKISALQADIGLVHGRLDSQKLANDGREERQTARDQNNVQSLVNLRSSTQKAFDQVRDDVASLLKQIQKLNERVGIAESKISLTMVGPSPVDQEIVDSKLKGARSYVDTLEFRIEDLEEEMALIIAVRQANEAFMRGPSADRYKAQGTTPISKDPRATEAVSGTHLDRTDPRVNP